MAISEKDLVHQGDDLEVLVEDAHILEVDLEAAKIIEEVTVDQDPP